MHEHFPRSFGVHLVVALFCGGDDFEHVLERWVAAGGGSDGVEIW